MGRRSPFCPPVSAPIDRRFRINQLIHHAGLTTNQAAKRLAANRVVTPSLRSSLVKWRFIGAVGGGLLLRDVKVLAVADVQRCSDFEGRNPHGNPHKKAHARTHYRTASTRTDNGLGGRPTGAAEGPVAARHASGLHDIVRGLHWSARSRLTFQ